MITVGMNYEVREGKNESFEQKFYDVLAALELAPGHSESRLYRDVKKPNDYIILSEWNDKTAFVDFIKSDTFRSVTNWGKEEILSGRPRHRVFGE